MNLKKFEEFFLTPKVGSSFPGIFPGIRYPQILQIILSVDICINIRFSLNVLLRMECWMGDYIR